MRDHRRAGRNRRLPDGAGGHRRRPSLQHSSDGDSSVARGVQTAGVSAQDEEPHNPRRTPPRGHRNHLEQHRLQNRPPPGI